MKKMFITAICIIGILAIIGSGGGGSTGSKKSPAPVKPIIPQIISFNLYSCDDPSCGQPKCDITGASAYRYEDVAFGFVCSNPSKNISKIYWDVCDSNGLNCKQYSANSDSNTNKYTQIEYITVCKPFNYPGTYKIKVNLRSTQGYSSSTKVYTVKVSSTPSPFDAAIKSSIFDEEECTEDCPVGEWDYN